MKVRWQVNVGELPLDRVRISSTDLAKQRLRL
jgi:hypothetical protein